jgi:hypothetical protein
LEEEWKAMVEEAEAEKQKKEEEKRRKLEILSVPKEVVSKDDSRVKEKPLIPST